MPQTPCRPVHALLDRMACGKNIVVENNRERGSKHGRENETAKKTCLRANVKETTRYASRAIFTFIKKKHAV